MIVVLESVFYGFWALILIFATCEFAQRFTDAFNGINDVISQLHWHEYPPEIQQLLIFIIMYAQKPVGIAFFGSISCSRVQFRKVQQLFYILIKSPPFSPSEHFSTILIYYLFKGDLFGVFIFYDAS